jgi:predicted alpha/beta hydrolase
LFPRDSIDLAKAGYLVLTFDYRGWGESAESIRLAVEWFDKYLKQ